MNFRSAIGRIMLSIFQKASKHSDKNDRGYMLSTLEKARNLRSIFGRRKRLPALKGSGIHFDRHGKMIACFPFPGLCESNNCFYLSPPSFRTVEDYGRRLNSLRVCPYASDVTPTWFRDETERLTTHLYRAFEGSRIHLCTCLPVVMPRIDFSDLGSFIEICMEYVNLSYRRTFKDRGFSNRKRGELTDHVGIVHGCKQDGIIERMRKEPFVVLYFPNALQGYSIEAGREQIRLCPEGFALAGLETIIAMMMYPDILARDLMTPGLDLGAFYWNTESYSLSFGTDGKQLGFVATKDLRGSLGISSVGISYQHAC